MVVPQMPPDLRRKLRAAYPRFGTSDLAVRWLTPILLFLAFLSQSWAVAGVAVSVFVVAFYVRWRQFPVIVGGESRAPDRRGGQQLQAVPHASLERYYRTWPDIHRESGYPSLFEEVHVWCWEHEEWELGGLSARAIPPALPGMDELFNPSIHLELGYGRPAKEFLGSHDWELGGTSFLSRGEVEWEGSAWELMEIRSKGVNRSDDEELAIAVLLHTPNNWGLVMDELPKTHFEEGLDATIEVRLPPEFVV